MARDNEHLGDGVYASHDGYQIWLAANHHDNRVIALEPGVLRQLIAYAKRIGMDTGGATCIEYALLLALLGLVAFAVIAPLGYALERTFQSAHVATEPPLYDSPTTKGN